MSSVELREEQVQLLADRFGDRIQLGAPLAPYTSARLGGPAEALLTVRSATELAQAAQTLWESGIAFRMLGGGSNVLVADSGLSGVVVLNRARANRFEESAAGPHVWAESGASFGAIARRAVERGWAGLEWAATVPGTVGGAIVNNAGAHEGDVAGSLEVAEILHRDRGRSEWPVKRLDYAYRESWLKRHPGQAVVLAGTFRLEASTVEATRARMEAFVEHRRRTQPPGASWGSMFKNPLGDFAGRLIEAAGLKGLRYGGAQISERHANFFINHGEATAADAWALIQKAREEVERQFGIELELEIELLGEWQAPNGSVASGEGER